MRFRTNKSVCVHRLLIARTRIKCAFGISIFRLIACCHNLNRNTQQWRNKVKVLLRSSLPSPFVHIALLCALDAGRMCGNYVCGMYGYGGIAIPSKSLTSAFRLLSLHIYKDIFGNVTNNVILFLFLFWGNRAVWDWSANQKWYRSDRDK